MINYLLFFCNTLLLSTILFSFNTFLIKNIILTSNLSFNLINIQINIHNKYISNLLIKLYLISSFITFYIFSIIIYNKFRKSLFKSTNKSTLNINTLQETIITLDCNPQLYLYENDLYQNILITGSIGSGKTSCMMYPLTKELIKYKNNKQNEKLSFLILDVKGNYHKYVKTICKQYNRTYDYVEISLSSNFTYNPLDKPNISPIIISNRLKTILLLFSPQNSESFWIDKAQTVICECIKLCRLYNNGYVNFEEIHKLINTPNYIDSKVEILRKKFITNSFNNCDKFNLLSSLDFFNNEFFKLDTRTISILRSEISRITNIFISDYYVNSTFSPKSNKNSISITDSINEGKIIILNLSLNEHHELAKIISTYLKLDFQDEIMINLSNSNINRSSAFICDEYHEFITKSDANFFSQSREAHCINIVCTQSYSSLLNTIKDENTLNMILQNLINKFWFRTDDIYTIEKIQKILGKIEKTKRSESISESSKNSNYNFISKKILSDSSNFSKSINTYTQFDYIFDTNFFTKDLKKFNCLSFITNNGTLIDPIKINFKPYFLKERDN